MRKVIVMGGSAGGIQSLCTVLKGLPPDLDAPVLAVIHTTQHSHFLTEVLERCGTLPVEAPVGAVPLRTGRVYVASPNRHLVVRSHCAVSWMGPRENRHRPAVDALFRSAARTYRSHVIGVVLSGALDDGSAGALAVKARGGTVIVQDPAEAAVDQMPANVLRQVETDYCLPLAQIAPLLMKLAAQGRAIPIRRPTAKQCHALAQEAFGEAEPTGFSCPECGGVVKETKEGPTTQFRCHVGHVYSQASFTEAHADALERAMWVALRRLNEQRGIQEQLIKSTTGAPALKKRHLENAQAVERDMRLLHEILSGM